MAEFIIGMVSINVFTGSDSNVMTERAEKAEAVLRKRPVDEAVATNTAKLRSGLRRPESLAGFTNTLE